MVRIKPFRGIRPPKQYASEVASRPYDVLNSAEAKAEATERSLLHIIKPEIDFDPIADEHSQEVYDKAVENFRAWREKGWLEQDPEEYYYIYAQTMDGRTQYGLTMCCNYEDYLSGAIKKHELTRPDKEEDRMIHVRNQKANIEPVFFAYPDNAEIDAIVAGVVENNAPEYDFTAADGFGHKLWVIRDRKTNNRITEIFKDIPALYVADGHHRTAAAARVGQECQRRNPDHTGCEEYCYFLAVTFPAGQLRIIDYNRVVKDLNGLTSAQLLEKLAENFTVEDKGAEEYRPSGLHNFSMYLDGRWYSLTAKPGTYDDNDPIGVLDVTVLSNLVLDRILDIKDLRTKSYNIENLSQILQEVKTRVGMQTFRNDESQEEEAHAKSSVVATGTGFVLGMILYMFLLIYGSMVMQSVIEEKNSRVLEVMVSSVRPFDLMLGKILGVASVAVVQVLIWGALCVVGALAVAQMMPPEMMEGVQAMQQGVPGAAAAIDVNPEMLQVIAAITDFGFILRIFAYLLLFVFGGYLFYSAMFAAVGSAVDSIQDAQQLQTPITIPIILALLVMISVVNDPNSQMAFWFSMIPFTSPVVMMARIPYGIPLWEIILSLVILYASFTAMVWFAAKIYRVGIFMYGKKPTFKELYKWMRYKY